jgi:glycosyltransferase involved in cell wall biosynthesis
MSSLTILLPCLNEAETIEICIKKSQHSLSKFRGPGEVLIADNGSTDGSQKIAEQNGARVISVAQKGYGSALIAGINASTSKYIIMGDADDSYDLSNLGEFITSLEEGNDLVMGNRFKGGISPGAMPWLHKYIGNPILSWLGRLFFRVPIGDFHCGLRAFNKESIMKLDLKCPGMEFASELVVKSALHGLKITEVPTKLKPDGRSRRPHLKTWRDGWRHLIFLLTASPKWLFFYPSLFVGFISLIGIGIIFTGPFDFFSFQFDLNSYFMLVGIFLISMQVLLFGILSLIFSNNFGITNKSYSFVKFEKIFNLEKGIALSLLLISTACLISLWIFGHWSGKSLQGIDAAEALRFTGLAILLFGVGAQILFASFFAVLLQNKISDK